MKVVIFGASGFSGKAILKVALFSHHEVTVLVRDRSKLGISSDKLKVFEGNVLDRAKVAEVLEGQEAVIQCLGVGGKGDGRPNTFVSDATKIIVDEMEKKGIRRLIAMSNVGAGNSIAFLPAIFAKIILPWFMKWLQAIIDDKNRMEPLIMNSKLDWTIVRCPNIVDKPAKNNFRATLDGKGMRLSITLGDMATFIVQQLMQTSYVRQAPSISN